MRIRKNIECLKTSELHDLREAFATLYQLPESNPKSYTRIAGLHGMPSPSYCNHSGTSGFLSWHRVYLLELENALREYGCNVTIPFWDWNSTSNKGIPDVCKTPTYVNRIGNTVDNPLYRGPIAPSAGGGNTTRRSDINTVSFADLAISANSNQSETNFNNYANTLNGIHGSVHVRCSGSMSSVAYAAFDPIFFFHHANVDRLWSNWQTNVGGTIPLSELNSTLLPFPKAFTNNWYKGVDFQNITDWDYSYRNWCFVFPPIFWPEVQLIKIPIEPWVIKSKRINLVLKSSSMLMQSMEIRVFINDQEANQETKLIDNLNYAGSFGIFGMGKAHGLSIYGDTPQKHYLDLTNSIRNSINKRSKELTINLIPVTGNSSKPNIKQAEILSIEIEAI